MKNENSGDAQRIAEELCYAEKSLNDQRHAYVHVGPISFTAEHYHAATRNAEDVRNAIAAAIAQAISDERERITKIAQILNNHGSNHLYKLEQIRKLIEDCGS